MIKLGTLFWLVLVSLTGFAMFAVKYGVQSLEDDLNRIKKATIAEELPSVSIISLASNSRSGVNCSGRP